MNTKELRRRITIQWKGCGNYKVAIEYRGEFYSCTSHNSLAYDRIKNCDVYSDKVEVYGYTYKQALLSFYDECKRANDL